MADRNTAELVVRAKSGDQDAFGILVERHRNLVLAICSNYTHNFTDSQDLAQECLIRAFSKLHQLKNPERFGSWLCRIANSICLDWKKSPRQASVPLEDADELPNEIEPLDGLALNLERLSMVAASLQVLPESFRHAASLHYLAGYSCDEIAKMTGTPTGTIKVRLMRSRAKLKEFMTDRYIDHLTIQNDGGSLTRRVLAGVSALDKDEIFSHIRALQSVIASQGIRVDWDILMGSSGEAFCCCFSPSWSYHAPLIRTWDTMTNGCEAYGLQGKWHLGGTFEEAIVSIQQSLDRNWPIAAPGVNPTQGGKGGTEQHHWFVITGCDVDLQQFTIEGAEQKEKTVPFPWTTPREGRVFRWYGLTRCLSIHTALSARNAFYTLDGTPSLPNLDDLGPKSIAMALQISSEGPFHLEEDGDIEVRSGLVGIRALKMALKETLSRDLSAYTPPIGTIGHFGTVYGYTRRHEISRRSASAYFHRLSETHSSDKSQLEEVASLYEQSAKLASALFDLYFERFQETDLLAAVRKYPKPAYYTCDEYYAFWRTFQERFLNSPKRREDGVDIVSEIIDCEETVSKRLSCLAAGQSRFIKRAV